MKVQIGIFDTTGKEIKRLLDQKILSASILSVPFDVSNLGSGIYIYRVIIAVGRLRVRSLLMNKFL